MELREVVPGSLVWVKPLADTHPEVEVQLLRLTQSENQGIWTRAGVRPDPKSQTWEQWTKASRMMLLKSVVDWKGFTDKGVELKCNDETKIRLLDKLIKIVDKDGEEVRRPIWRLITDALDKADEEEEKN